MGNNYNSLIKNIGAVLEQGRRKVSYAINNILVKTYWEIGKKIIKYEQEGKKRANYGEILLKTLSKDLKRSYGKGFSRSNIQYMRLLFLTYKKCQTVSGKFNSTESQTLSDKLTWSHYIELLSITDNLERSFYEKQCINENWSIRELKRQINSGLFYRYAFSKNKEAISKLAKKGKTIEKAEDVIKDPYILEFLNIHENNNHTEKELEQKIINNLQKFLFELGNRFTFVARQYRITINNTHFYVDLVFYHKILNCYILIDLKMGKVNHTDIGQMNLYLNYFKEEINEKRDNIPIGIVLAAHKDDILIRYALGGISNQLFVSKYQLYLPKKEELQNKIKKVFLQHN